MITLATEANVEPFVAAACGGLFRNMGRVLSRVIGNSPIGRVVYIVEHSERLRSEYEKLMGPTGPTFFDTGGNQRKFPHVWAALRKTNCEPGLEVSDFVLHAAHGHVRGRMEGKLDASRADFECVFRSASRDLVEYMEITKLQSEPMEGPPGLQRISLQ